MRLARGRYVTFVDSDDWLAPECLEKAYRRAKEGDLDVVTFGWVRFEDGSGEEIPWRTGHENLNLGDPDVLRKAAFSNRISPSSCSSLVKINLFRDHNLQYPKSLHEDVHTTPLLFLYGNRFGYIDKVFYFYRVRKGSITQTTSKAHIDSIVGVFDSWKAHLSAVGKFDDFRDAACAGMFNYIFNLLGRIEAFAGNSPDLLSYLRDQVRSIPEIEHYRKNRKISGDISPVVLQNHAKVAAFLERGSKEGERFFPAGYRP